MIPARHPLARQVEQRQDVAAGQQNPVECSDGGNELRPVFCCEQGVDHGIDGGALNAGKVECALGCRGFATPSEILLVSW